MQPQISRGSAGPNRRRTRSFIYLLDLSHRKSILHACLWQNLPQSAPLVDLTFTAAANIVIPAITASELKHRMHQVSST